MDLFAQSGEVEAFFTLDSAAAKSSFYFILHCLLVAYQVHCNRCSLVTAYYGSLTNQRRYHLSICIGISFP